MTASFRSDASADVPIGEVAAGVMEVRILRQSGPDLLILSSSQFDPEPSFTGSTLLLKTDAVQVSATFGDQPSVDASGSLTSVMRTSAIKRPLETQRAEG